MGLKEQTRRRFDTLFYIAFQDAKLEAKLDNQEVTSMQFTDPKAVLQSHIDSELWLAPPQFWELSRMSNFTKFDDLKTFSMNRECRGCETWLPVLKPCTDGLFALYPGDNLYPEHPDYEGNQDVDMSGEESVHDSKFCSGNLNRMVQIGLHNYSIHVNIEDPFGHLVPKNAPSPSKIENSKL